MQYESDTSDSFQGLFGGPAEFASQCVEVYIDGSGVVLKAGSPDLIPYLYSRADTIGMGGEIIQQTVFECSQMDFLSVLAYCALLAVNLYRIDDGDVH